MASEVVADRTVPVNHLFATAMLSEGGFADYASRLLVRVEEAEQASIIAPIVLVVVLIGVHSTTVSDSVKF